jgi:hypothetical protein
MITTDSVLNTKEIRHLRLKFLNEFDRHQLLDEVDIDTASQIRLILIDAIESATDAGYRHALTEYRLTQTVAASSTNAA